ncbi:hypothetical protein WG66_005941 [Moniliophthora roreri]|nr:hypothetical protein WG66_005941 [Moniliophthora roreri]
MNSGHSHYPLPVGACQAKFRNKAIQSLAHLEPCTARYDAEHQIGEATSYSHAAVPSTMLVLPPAHGGAEQNAIE